MEGMLHPTPETRWTVAQIKESDWYKEDANLLTEDEVLAAMKSRRVLTKQKILKKRNAQDEQRKEAYKRGNEQYDDDESKAKLAKMKKHHQKTGQWLKTLLYSNVHPFELADEFVKIEDQTGVAFECEDEEEKPFSYKVKIQVENEMIPLLGEEQ